ncbi:hypothetical protein HOY80DRAFT_944388 [Tuber brumale]|nr:hypothetical protein HOY80DRAFT_944388 [Tuber brumale]
MRIHLSLSAGLLWLLVGYNTIIVRSSALWFGFLLSSLPWLFLFFCPLAKNHTVDYHLVSPFALGLISLYLLSSFRLASLPQSLG